MKDKRIKPHPLRLTTTGAAPAVEPLRLRPHNGPALLEAFDQMMARELARRYRERHRAQ